MRENGKAQEFIGVLGLFCSIGQKDLKIVSKQKSPKLKSPIRVANFFFPFYDLTNQNWVATNSMYNVLHFLSTQ